MTAGHTAASSRELWAATDGTVCRLSELDAPPRFELLLVRSGAILRCRRVDSAAAAHALAASWKDDAKDNQ
jgi:hypothetical protein